MKFYPLVENTTVRDYRVFEEVFHAAYKFCKGESRSGKFRFRNPIYALDSSKINLCLSLFDWAKYRKKKGAMKLHFQYDLRSDIPTFMVMSDGKKNDVKAIQKANLKIEQKTYSQAVQLALS